MKLRQLFTEHPQSVGETYAQHLGTACGFAARMLFGGFACFVHAFLPFAFRNAGSDCVHELYEHMIARRAQQVLRHAQRAEGERSQANARMRRAVVR
jgi:hypothetical protein